MAARIVDPTRFLLMGSVIDWTLAYRRDYGHLVPPQRIAAERGLNSTRLVQLRWVTDPGLGYPTAPFTVWRRRSEPASTEAPVGYVAIEFLGATMILFDRPRVFVRAVLTGSSGYVIGFAGMPFASPMIWPQAVTAAQTQYGFSAPSIVCLLISAGVTLGALTGLDGAAAQDLDWQPTEIVGLPVDATFDNVQHLDEKQGLIGAPKDPPDAALDRFRRGAPFYGWPSLLDTGTPAPGWRLANPDAMLQVVADKMLPPLRLMVELPAEQQGDYTLPYSLASPNGRNPTATVSPLRTLVYGAATDPLASLITGFGTAFEAPAGEPGILDTGYSYDYMVTARYDNGTGGEPGPLEYAAIVFAPGVAPVPPAPTGVTATVDGLAAPAGTDLDWTGVIRASWDRLGDDLPVRVGSYALARTQLAPAGGVKAILGARPNDTALQPIGASTSEANAGSGRLNALDDSYHLATAPNPNQLSYSVTLQDLFGQWSGWASASLTVGEPPPGIASLIAGSWDVTAAAAVCPGTLTVDLAWDWANRSPSSIDLAGRMYSQAQLDDPPGDLSVPAGLPPSLAGGAGQPLTIAFDSAGTATVTAAAGLSASVQYFDEKATSLSSTVQGAIAGPRRYRLSISGFGLDYTGTGAIGMALWARGTEARAGRTGAWSATPLIVSAADPRPPVMAATPEDVLLTSMPDPAGEYHALLQWTAAPGAVGYFAYTCSETDLLDACGLGDPAFSQTLSDRLATLRAAFQASPVRSPFTRLNATPVTATSLEVTLPRGTKDIHLFVVLGVSAGQVESAWPDSADPDRGKRPIAYAAPHVVAPNPPTIEVVTQADTTVTPTAYRAAFRLSAVPGVTATRIDLYRTRVAAAASDTDMMGPPLASITGSTATITVTPVVSANPGESQPLGRVDGIDAVPGSWQPVYYRATSWAADDPARGQYGGRSEPSTIRQVVVPPASNPDLAPLTVTTPVNGTPQVLVDSSTGAPVDATPLGPHRIQAEAIVTHADGTSEELFAYPGPPASGTAPDDALGDCPQAAPAAGTSGLWRDPTTMAGTTALHLQLARAAFGDQLAARLRIADPLGRITEQVATVPPLPPVIPPDITNARVITVPGRGVVLTFDTSVPDAATGFGPYQVRVALTEFTPPPLHLPHVVQVTEDIGAIRVLGPGGDIFTDPAPIPLRQLPGAGGGRSIAAVLRGTGTVTAEVIAPDGTQATVTRIVP
jgi:hypothetical protein